MNKKAFQQDVYLPLALTVNASAATTKCHSGGGGPPQMNKFEQVSSDDLYSEVKDVMGNGHMGPPL